MVDRSPERHAELAGHYREALTTFLQAATEQRRTMSRPLVQFIEGLNRNRGTVADILQIHNTLLDEAIGHTSGASRASLATRGHKVAVDAVARFVGAQMKAARAPAGPPGLRTGQRASGKIRVDR